MYPWIDNYTFREHFINKMDITGPASSGFNMRKFEVLMSSVKYSNRFKDKIDARWVDPPRGISRFTFIELLFRISKFLYSTMEIETASQVHMMRLNEDST